MIKCGLPFKKAKNDVGCNMHWSFPMKRGPHDAVSHRLENSRHAKKDTERGAAVERLKSGFSLSYECKLKVFADFS